MLDCSVIIPMYNAESTIQDCIDSVLAQKDVTYEIIIVDDGSTDCCAEICKRNMKKYNNFHLIQTDNRGVSHARNCGLSKAQGTYIYFMDADDILTKSALYTLIFQAKQQTADLLIACYEEVNVKNNESVVRPLSIPYGKILGQNYIKSEIFKTLYMKTSDGISNLWNKVFLRKIIDENKTCFDIMRTHGEDWAFVIDYLQHANRIYGITDVVYRYRLDGSQQYSKYRKGLLYSFVDGYKRVKCMKDSGCFHCSDVETALFELRFLTNVLFVCSHQLTHEERKYMHDERSIVNNAKTVANLPKTILYQTGFSRRIKIAAILVVIKCYRTAAKFSNSFC